MEKVDFYCQLFETVYERVSKVCPEGAREVALKIIEEIAKDIRSEQARQLKAETKVEEGSVTSDELATKKQREALHKFGIEEIPENLSKKEASEILDRLVGFSKGGDSESIAKFVKELNAKWKKSQ
jgi:SAM-dependent MidA family methyltransferase